MLQKLVVAICVSVVFFFCFSCNEKETLYHNYTTGNAFGTTFSVQFFAQKEVDFSKAYDSLTEVINASMSTYIADSDISRINNGDSTVVVDTHFERVFNASKVLYDETEGVFDPTIGVLVNAWDFGPQGAIASLDSLKIDSLLQTVGLHSVFLYKKKIIKKDPRTYLDFNSLAKGYAVDVFSEFIESKGFENYLVEIGGEIRGKGMNQKKQQPWRIGVEDPNFDDSQSYSKVVELYDLAMATSGNYRKYKTDENGNRYAHIIDTKTGYPHKSNILSVSVLANRCMEADAYATALMSMTLEQAQAFLKKHKELKAFFIYEDDAKELKTLAVNGFPDI